MKKELWLKLKEALGSVLPIAIIVILLCLTIAPLPVGTVGLFLVGTVMLILGMGLFSLGADMAMMPMGERIGAQLSKSGKIVFLAVAAFIMGALITVAEPDLQVLARQVPTVPNAVLILSVALGVGIFLVIALLRILWKLRLSWLLIFLYSIVFIVAAFVPGDFLAVAFDSGGVTTGPITVPFILALGIGIAAVRGGRSSRDDSFGLVALCSIGPILAVMIMGIFYNPAAGAAEPAAAVEIQGVAMLLHLFLQGLPLFAKEVGIALLPIVGFFIFFQVFFLNLPRQMMKRMTVGIVYTYLGLVLFLTGVNVGFMPAGNELGATIAALPHNWVLIPLGMVIGFFVVMAEPAVHVLNKQVEEISVGAISRQAMLYSLAIGVAISLGLAMIRVLTGIPILYLLLPGYVLAIALSFAVPRIFTAIAFDSGGVASGPMTATFLLPFAMGACEALGGNVMTDAFGVVAMVAMTPLLTIQLLGLVYAIKMRKLAEVQPLPAMTAEEEELIIDFADEE
ncbi:MAG: DUF1538 domain-containing protein [Syntrophomonadaceae bacterium]|nr:DUF1538 domain-containing protein [Syntrophomonadaceae bacterium]